MSKLRRYLCCGGNPDLKLEDDFAKQAVAALNINKKQLTRLRYNYDEIDVDGSGSIDSIELFEAMEEASTPFTDALFNLMDLDGSGTIEFSEYVRVLVTYCMYSKEDILRFAFDCFDKDGSGTIDEKEFMELCQGINNAAPMFPGNYSTAMKQFDVNDDGLIDFREFSMLNDRYPMVLYPAFRLQEKMWQKTLGERAWVKIREHVERSKRVREYAQIHGGPPPEKSVFKKYLYKCMPWMKPPEIDLSLFSAYQMQVERHQPQDDF